jgi:hypothetical protein
MFTNIRRRIKRGYHPEVHYGFQKSQAVSHLEITPTAVLADCDIEQRSRSHSRIKRCEHSLERGARNPTHQALGYFCEPSEKGAGRSQTHKPPGSKFQRISSCGSLAPRWRKALTRDYFFGCEANLHWHLQQCGFFSAGNRLRFHLG